MFSFPCNVQTHTDIVSSSGNGLLMENAEAFREYMEYAQTDYVYVEAGYLTEDQYAYELLSDCIRDGVLTDVFYEDGNALARVDPDGRPGEAAEEEMEAFRQFYVPSENFS